MSRRSKKPREPFTVLVVPHTDQPPISLRIAPWTVYACLLVAAAALVGIILLVSDYRATQAQLAALRQDRQGEIDRQRDMRQTILSQDEQVRSLSAETLKLGIDLLSLDRMVADVRRIVGLDRLTATPSPTATVTPTLAPALSPSSERPAAQSLRPDALAAAASFSVSAPGRDDARAAATVSSRGSAPAARDSRVTVAQTEGDVSARLSDLMLLTTWVQQRVSLVDLDKRGTPAEIERQLRLYDAAPKLAPITGPINITSRYGWRNDPLEPWNRTFHEGVDMSAWYSTPVYATAEGKVIFAGWKDYFGWTVEIQHEMGYRTLFGHNQELAVRTGQTVAAGQVIAYVGDTGRSTGPHVHYQMTLDGETIDPLRFMQTSGGTRVQPKQ